MFRELNAISIRNSSSNFAFSFVILNSDDSLSDWRHLHYATVNCNNIVTKNSLNSRNFIFTSIFTLWTNHFDRVITTEESWRNIHNYCERSSSLDESKLRNNCFETVHQVTATIFESLLRIKMVFVTTLNVFFNFNTTIECCWKWTGLFVAQYFNAVSFDYFR